MNQYLEAYLRCFCNTKPVEWSKWLHWDSFWHNTTQKAAVGYTPYEIVYGRPSPSLHQYAPKTARVQAMEDSLFDRDQILKLLKDHYVKAQQIMKWYEDKRRSERQFEVETSVQLKLQSYEQSSIKRSLTSKLAAKYYGPYKIIERVGKVDYKLQCLSEAKIHNTFHVCQLKKYNFQTTSSPIELPNCWKIEENEPREFCSGVWSKEITKQ